MLAAYLAHHRAARARLAAEAAGLEAQIAETEAELRGARAGARPGERAGPRAGAARGGAGGAGGRALRPVSLPAIGLCRNAFRRKAEAPRQPFLGPARGEETEILVAEGQQAALTAYLASLPPDRPAPPLFLFHYFFDRNSAWACMTLPPKQTRRVGLFSCRTPHRPNALGQSVGLVVSCGISAGLCSSLRVRGLDTLDGTPVLALTPYSPEMDCWRAHGGWMEQDRLLALYYDAVGETNRVSLSPEAERACALAEELGLARGLRETIVAKLERTHPLSRSHKAKAVGGEGEMCAERDAERRAGAGGAGGETGGAAGETSCGSQNNGEARTFADTFCGFKAQYTCKRLAPACGARDSGECGENGECKERREFRGPSAPGAPDTASVPDSPGPLAIAVSSVLPTLSRAKAEEHSAIDPEAALVAAFYRRLLG